MAKRKTPKSKKKQTTPADARAGYMESLGQQVEVIRQSILKENPKIEKMLNAYAILYKNLLLEHYKSININHKEKEKEVKNKK